MNSKVIIENYNENWSKIFKEIKSVLLSEIAIDIISIEHVGSTSVKGLKAKPILDIDIIIENDVHQVKVINKLKSLGYLHIGNLGISGREAFKRENDNVPFTENNKTWMKHNLYLCSRGSLGLNNHLKFRDYLRNHPKVVEDYGNLKVKLANEFPYYIDKYIEGKTAFIVSILEKEGIDKEFLNQIIEENRLK